MKQILIILLLATPALRPAAQGTADSKADCSFALTVQVDPRYASDSIFVECWPTALLYGYNGPGTPVNSVLTKRTHWLVIDPSGKARFNEVLPGPYSYLFFGKDKYVNHARFLPLLNCLLVQGGDCIHLDIRSGNCREAFRFYEEHLGGTIISMETFRQMPDEANIPDERKDEILHGRIAIGGMVVMGADIPGAEPMRSAYLTLRMDSTGEAEKMYQVLSEKGEIFMKMEETAFAARFAMLRDRFGASWMLLCE